MPAGTLKTYIRSGAQRSGVTRRLDTLSLTAQQLPAQDGRTLFTLTAQARYPDSFDRAELNVLARALEHQQAADTVARGHQQVVSIEPPESGQRPADTLVAVVSEVGYAALRDATYVELVSASND